MWATVEELEAEVGQQLRRERLRRDLTVEQVAEKADVSAKTVLNLEHGRGSTLTTVVKVLRALELEEWLTTIAPDEPISPIAIRDQQQASRRRRASGRGRG